MKEIIDNLYIDNGAFNSEAVLKARQNKGAINDVLLKQLKKEIDSYAKNKNRLPIFVDYAIFLLAEFREKKAFPLILKLISLDQLGDIDYFDDGIYGKIPSILVSVYDGDLASLNNIIEDKNIKSFVRGYVLLVYKYLYLNDLIDKDELIKYLRKVILILEEASDYYYISDSIISIVADCHLFEMVEDIRKLFYNGQVDLDMRGGYDDFIDELFDYEIEACDVIEPILSVEELMEWWYCFHENDEFYKLKRRETDDKFEDYLNDKFQENDNLANLDFSKVGRNDSCPCGSGKKFKKCCMDKVESMLPYQKYINESLSRYPKKNDKDGEVDFYTYYKQEYIEIDKLLYKGIKHKRIPWHIKRNGYKELEIDFGYLESAWELIKELLDKNKFNTIEEYNNEVSIHYGLELFFGKYCECAFAMSEIYGNFYLQKTEEIIRYFFDNFEITHDYSHIFVTRVGEYYGLSKEFEKGIAILEGWIKDAIYCRNCIYDALVELYNHIYDYDEMKSKLDMLISQEKDEKYKATLLDLKREYLEDDYYEEYSGTSDGEYYF